MKKISLFLLLVITITFAKTPVDYNGNPINRSGGITITPQTSSDILASYTQAFNNDGLLDATFGANGIVNTVGTGAGNGSANAAVLQPDGKIVVVGGNGTNFQLIRYNSNGSIDTTFNGGTPVTTSATNIAFAALLQPDGKIVAVGGNNNNPNIRKFCLVRYNTDGSIDTTFNEGTPVTTIGKRTALAALLQPDGKIVVIGNSQTLKFCLVRYNPNGSIDLTFNGGTPITTLTASVARAALLQPDGKIVAVGQNAANNFCLIRYNPDGSIDPTFNGGNPVTTANTQIAYAALLQPDGKIVVVGQNAANNFCLVRYNADGSINLTFNGGAPVTTANTRTARTALLQPDGKIIAVGGNAANNFCLVRYNSNGSLDSTFGPLGTSIVTTAGTTSNALCALLQADEKILAIGTASGVAPNLFDFVLTRYVNPFTFASFTASYGTVGLL